MIIKRTEYAVGQNEWTNPPEIIWAVDPEMAQDERTLRRRYTMLGPEHLHTIAEAIPFAAGLNFEGENDAAEFLYRRCLRALEVWHSDDPQTLKLRLTLAKLLRKKARYAGTNRNAILREAVAHNRKVVEDSRRLLGLVDTDTATAIESLVILLRDQGEFRAGEALLRELLNEQTSLFGADDPDTLKTTKLLGDLFFGEGNDIAAREHYELAYERGKVWRSEFGSHRPDPAKEGLDAVIARMAPKKTAKRKVAKKDHV